MAMGLVILSCIVSLYAYHLKSSLEAVTHEFEAFKVELEVQSRLQVAKNIIIENNAKKSINLEIEKHKQVTEQLKLDRDKLAKELKHEINNHKRNFTVIDRVQLKPNNSNIALPKASSSPEGLTESERERDTAFIDSLIRAGASCAADYNLARAWIDTACLNYGCLE